MEQYAVGFYLGNEALRDAVNEQLLAMAEDGTMMSIAESMLTRDFLSTVSASASNTSLEIISPRGDAFASPRQPVYGKDRSDEHSNHAGLSLSRRFSRRLPYSSLTLLGSLPLGLVVYFARKSRFSPLRWLTKVYIAIMRGTPLMLQVMVVYYGPSLLLGMTLPRNWRFAAVIVAFVINYAAYFAEIYRGGIESISAGQYEAAQVLGYRRGQTFFRIILPQMVKRVLPSVTNEVITLVKRHVSASVIGTVEMFTRAKQIAVAPNSPGMLAFAAAAVFYFVFNSLVAFAMERIEKAFAHYR